LESSAATDLSDATGKGEVFSLLKWRPLGVRRLQQPSLQRRGGCGKVAVTHLPLEEEKMKRVLLLGVVLAVALYATVAWAATPPTPMEKKLQKDVATLKAQVKTLKKSVSDLRDVALAVAVVGACNTAITADGLQGTWQEIDQLSAATQADKTYFGPQTPVNDAIGNSNNHWCALASVNRSQALPPTVAQFSALLALYQTTAAKVR
jgi:hypothetical protein